MSAEGKHLEQLPIAELMRRRVRALFDRLGAHRAPDLYRRVIREVERVLLEEALERANGSRKQAAEILGIHRNTLRLRMRSLGIQIKKKR